MKKIVLLSLVIFLAACSNSTLETNDVMSLLEKPFGNTNTIEPQAQNSYNVLQLSSGFYLPTSQRHNQTSPRYIGYGDRNPKYGNECHLANDYYAQPGTSVFAIADGLVVAQNSSVGNYGGDTPSRSGGAIVIKHQTSSNETFYALYGHVKNSKVKRGDLVVASQKIGEVGTYFSGTRALPHLHFGIRRTFDQNKYRGYTTGGCRNYYSFVDPEPYMEGRNPLGHEFHGAGSLINPNANCFGCQKDVTRMHASGKKPMVAFQWRYDSNRCDHILINTDGGTNPFTGRSFQETPLKVGILARHWAHGLVSTRDEFYSATLPVSIGHPRQSFNLVGVMLPEQLPSGHLNIRATCRTKSQQVYDNKDILQRASKGITLTDGSKWNGNASIINNAPVLSGSSGRYGVSLDEVLLTDNGYNGNLVAFQWQRSSQCKNLLIVSRNRPLKFTRPRVTITVKGWAESPNATRTQTVTLPYRITLNNFSNLKGYSDYNIITVKTSDRQTNSILAYCQS